MNSFRQDIYKYRKAELNDNEFYEGKSDVAGVYNKTLIWSHRETLMDTHLILLNLEFQCTCVNVGHLFIWESVIERRIKSARNHILPLQYHHCPSKNSIHTCRTILIQVNMNKRKKKKKLCRWALFHCSVLSLLPCWSWVTWSWLTLPPKKTLHGLLQKNYTIYNVILN